MIRLGIVGIIIIMNSCISIRIVDNQGLENKNKDRKASQSLPTGERATFNPKKV